MQYENYIGINSEKSKYFKELNSLLKIKNAKNCSLIRIGTPNGDGGYMMADNFKNGKIAYSFGISDNADWENDIAHLGYQVFMYDHTIDKLPLKNKNFHFFKNGISAIDTNNSPLKTLQYYIRQNGHEAEQNMLLKLDVEGYEWGVFETISTDTLKQFNQIVVEFHNLLGGNENCLKILEKINSTHHLIHTHKNDLSISAQIDDINIPNILEVTYINKNLY